MLNGPFSPWPHFEDDEIQATVDTLKSGKVNYWTGSEGKEFEKEFAAFHDSKHGVVVANGTLAIDLCWKALGVGEGDEVIVTPRSFMASASSIALSGAKPVFADIDRDSQNITAETIAKVLTPKTKAILCVHLAGWPCDMDPILELAKSKGIYVVEDCAQAHGAEYKGKKVGSLGDMAAFSFCQDKIMTTGGEGGMVLTNDENLWKKAWAFKDHGKNYDTVFHKDHPPGFRWLHEDFGTNWRLSDVQSAIGRKQLEKLPRWLEKRSQNAKFLNEAFQSCSGLRLTLPPADIRHAYYKYYVFVEDAALKEGWDRDRISNEVQARGVPAFSGSCSEMYLEKAFEKAGLVPEKPLPVARELGGTSLMFMVHPTLTSDEIQKTAEVVRAVLQEAQR